MGFDTIEINLVVYFLEGGVNIFPGGWETFILRVVGSKLSSGTVAVDLDTPSLAETRFVWKEKSFLESFFVTSALVLFAKTVWEIQVFFLLKPSLNHPCYTLSFCKNQYF